MTSSALASASGISVDDAAKLIARNGGTADADPIAPAALFSSLTGKNMNQKMTVEIIAKKLAEILDVKNTESNILTARKLIFTVGKSTGRNVRVYSSPPTVN